MKGSRTLMHGSNSSVFKGLRKKMNENEEKRKDGVPIWNAEGSRTGYVYEKVLVNTVFIGLMAIKRERKRPWEKKKRRVLFLKVLNF